MKPLNKVVTVFAKIGEIVCWIACGFMAVCLGTVLLGKPDWLRFLSDFDTASLFRLDAFGLSVTTVSLTNRVYILFFTPACSAPGFMP